MVGLGERSTRAGRVKKPKFNWRSRTAASCRSSKGQTQPRWTGLVSSRKENRDRRSRQRCAEKTLLDGHKARIRDGPVTSGAKAGRGRTRGLLSAPSPRTRRGKRQPSAEDETSWSGREEPHQWRTAARMTVGREGEELLLGAQRRRKRREIRRREIPE